MKAPTLAGAFLCTINLQKIRYLYISIKIIMAVAVKKPGSPDWIMHLEDVSVLEKSLSMKNETEIAVLGRTLTRDQNDAKTGRTLSDRRRVVVRY